MTKNLSPFSKPLPYPLRQGASGNDVIRLQRYLEKCGYLRLQGEDTLGIFYPKATALRDVVHIATRGEFDGPTKEAVAAYQTFFNLKITGEIDAATSKLIARPRCGVPDLPHSHGGAGILSAGDAWPRTDLTYGFLELTSDLIEQEIRYSIVDALDLWSEVTPLTFTEIPVADNPDIVIRFVTGDHGDGNPFDGAGGILAHAFYPPPNGGAIAGDTHFDDDETWTLDVPVTPGRFDLLTIAAHEFGHALGLVHSSEQDAIMYPIYLGRHRYLDADDTPRIQARYGPRPAQTWNSIGHSLHGLGTTTPDPDSSLVLTANIAYGVRYRMRVGRDWDRWRYLGGEAAQIGSVCPVALSPGNGDVHVFMFSTNKEIHTRRFENDHWEPWQNLGGRKGYSFFSAAMAGDVPHVFINAGDNPDAPPGPPPGGWPQYAQVYERFFTGTGYSAWTPIGGELTTHHRPIESEPGVIELFAGGADGRLHSMRFDGVSWSAWQSIGGPRLFGTNGPHGGSSFSEAYAVAPRAGLLHVFIRDEQGRLQHIVRTDGVWSSWEVLSPEIRRCPFGVASRPDLIHVIVRGSDRILYLRSLNGTTWSNWESLGIVGAHYSATSRPDGTIDLYACDDRNSILHRVITFT